ncbi:MAG TPA: ATP-binding cassette domain-containing protein [bacterium]|nr:ATP-binding cassette domain-containing protein [bacterium]
MLEMAGVYTTLEHKEVLRGVSFSVADGETLVIIGRSGTGKSVILKHLIGLMHPDRGAIFVGGTDIAALRGPALRTACRPVAMLFQNGALFDSLRVWENVGFHLLENLDRPVAEVQRVVREKLALVDLHGVEQLMPAELSGGMRKRVALARTLALEPRVLLWDEPTSGLDPVTSDIINRLIVRTREQLGLTSVVVTHDMTSAYQVGQRIAMLHAGRIHTIGTPDRIRATTDPVVRRFITGDASDLVAAGNGE